MIIPDVPERNKTVRNFRPLCDHLFHPHGVVPFSEFVSAEIVFSHQLISHPFVKPDAVVVQVPVLLRNKIGIIVLLFSILKPGMLAKYILSYLHWPVTQILGRAGNNLWQYSHLCAIVVRQ